MFISIKMYTIHKNKVKNLYFLCKNTCNVGGGYVIIAA
jgi:hypothetical protein